MNILVAWYTFSTLVSKKQFSKPIYSLKRGTPFSLSSPFFKHVADSEELHF